MNIIQNQLKKCSLIFITLLCTTTFTYAQDLQGCAAKKRNIERQLKHAMLRGNKNEIKGLERALKYNTENCNEKDLQAENEQKKQKKLDKIIENQRKIDKLKIELEQEIRFGNHNEVLKKQKKLDKAQKELKEAKDQLTH